MGVQKELQKYDTLILFITGVALMSDSWLATIATVAVFVYARLKVLLHQLS